MLEPETDPWLGEAAVEIDPVLSSQTVENFSLVYGGPFDRVWLRLRQGYQSSRVAWRVALAVALPFIPLLLVSAAQGLAVGTRVRIPFLSDFAAQARFLVALPLLIGCEPAVDRVVRIVVREFLQSRLVKPEDLPKFESLLQRVEYSENSYFAEPLLAIIAFGSSWQSSIQNVLLHNSSTWHWVYGGAGAALSYAGCCQAAGPSPGWTDCQSVRRLPTCPTN
jgi:hypothetical protein